MHINFLNQDQPQEQPLVEDGTADTTEQKEPSAKDKKRWKEFRRRIEACESHRKKLIRNWSVNIDRRRGKLSGTASDDDNVYVNLDWSYTKTKQAALFSQVPKARVAHSPQSVTSGPWVAGFERRLNDILVEGGVEAAMDEVMPDTINAAGFGAVFISHDALTVDKDVPSIDLSIFPPEIVKTALTSGQLFGQPIPMETVPQAVASRYTIRRISPADFLWPIDFTGSDFDNAPWLGYSGRIPWAEAVSRFNLKEEEKDQLLGDDREMLDQLVPDEDREKLDEDGKIGFSEIFYHAHLYDETIKSYDVINHLVFLSGKKEPVVDEVWRGQIVTEQEDKSLQIIGARKKPIRVLTLAYISDEDIPPSDSAIIRPQVNELNKGRNHIALQRARSIPMTWADINRIDPMIFQALMKGDWNRVIPVQGDGSRVIGSVQQPAMNPESFIFDKIAKEDAQEMIGIGANQASGGEGVETKGEANIIQSNFATRIGRDRARVASFFVGIANIVGGMMCIYEDPAIIGEGFDPSFGERLAYSILADSTVLVDSNQRLEQLNNFLDTYAKSGWVNLEPVLKEVATLVGLDPNTVITKPQPPSPELPNISLRLTGGDDMMNPLLLAFMIKTGQAPDPKLIEQAKALIQGAVLMPSNEQPPNGPLPEGPPVNTGDANPQMSALPKIQQRSDDPSQELE